MARNYQPRDPNRPAEWFKVMAGAATHPRTAHLAHSVGGWPHARGLLLTVYCLASRRPLDGVVESADMLDPITGGLTSGDVDALVTSGVLTDSGGGEYAVRSWRKHQSALIALREGGAKGGKASFNPASTQLGDASSPSSPSPSESDPLLKEATRDPINLEASGSDGMGREEAESLLLTLAPNRKDQPKGATLFRASKYAQALHNAGSVTDDEYAALLDFTTPGALLAHVEPMGFNDLVGRLMRQSGTIRKTKAYARTSLARAWASSLNGSE